MQYHENAVYATQPKPLQQQISGLLKEANPSPINGNVFGVVVPYTNLLEGGKVAADVYKSLGGEQFDSVILVAPSHTGKFDRLTICSIDHYRTPLGDVPVNDGLRNELCDEDDDIFLDDRGHYQTQGIDAQIPFLQTVFKNIDIVPIVMGDESPALCAELGHAIGEVMYNRHCLLVACVEILDADDEGLELFESYFHNMDISRLSMILNSERVKCQGRGALLTAIIAALHRRANKSQILKIEKPSNEKAGYIGALLYRG